MTSQFKGNGLFGHGAIVHSHSQRLVLRVSLLGQLIGALGAANLSSGSVTRFCLISALSICYLIMWTNFVNRTEAERVLRDFLLYHQKILISQSAMWAIGSVPFAHVAIDHSHSQQPVPTDFPLFKRCEWLVINCNVGKRAPLGLSDLTQAKWDRNWCQSADIFWPNLLPVCQHSANILLTR